MRRLISLMVLLTSGAVWADGETLFVRPIEAEYGAEDGTSYATAYDGFQDVTWAASDTAGAVDPGDTLIVCGEFNSDSADGGNADFLRVGQAGSAGKVITIDGDCSSQGDLAEAILDPTGGTTKPPAGILRGIYVPTTTDYITIQNVWIRNLVGTGALAQGVAIGTNSTTEHNVAKNVTIDHVTVTGISGDEVTDSSNICINLIGSDITLSNSTIRDCWADGVWAVGERITVAGNTISQVSQGAEGGDCVQCTGAVTLNNDQCKILNNTCDHSDKDFKHCYVTGNAADSPTRWIVGNSCNLPTTALLAIGIGNTSGVVHVYRNSVHGGLAGIQLNNATQAYVVGNVVIDAYRYGIRTGSGVTAALVHNNTVYDISDYADASMCYTSDVNTAAQIWRNNIADTCTGAGIDMQGSTAIEQYNLIYNATTAVSNNCTTEGCAAASATPDTTDLETSPGFTDATPSTAADTKLAVGSAARRAGVSVGSWQDKGNRRFKAPPSIGAWEAASGDKAAPRTARQ